MVDKMRSIDVKLLEKHQLMIHASRTFVERGHDAKAKFSILENPANIIYDCIIFVAKHTPLMDVVPQNFPESFVHGEMEVEEDEDALTEYKKACEKFYSDLEEEFVCARESLNVNDTIPVPCARVTEKWVDIKLDDRWACVRIPKENIVIFTPHESEHGKEALERFRGLTYR